jgi:hypothetical protein
MQQTRYDALTEGAGVATVATLRRISLSPRLRFARSFRAFSRPDGSRLTPTNITFLVL